MTRYPVAALERQGAVLLAALGARREERVRVVTEDGRSFEYPQERLLWRARTLQAEGRTDREVAASLKVLRAGMGPAPDWRALRDASRPGVSADPRDLSGDGGDAGALAVAARAGESAPWFRLDHGKLVPSSDEEIARDREHAEAESRARDAEAALRKALTPGPARPLPEEARPALEALLDWALGPVAPGAPRPPVAADLGLAEPDDALERLEAAGLLPAGAMAPLSRRGLGRPFPRKVRDEAAAAAAAPDPAAGRQDLRVLAAFAVDDEETVEVDDAVSFLRGPGGEPHLLVHIADAAAAVPPGGPLDLEARRRATTIYTPDLRVPMLPPDLTAARLSLEAGAERPAVTAEVRLDAAGEPAEVRVFRSLVRVTRRMDYGGLREPSDLPPDLREVHAMARAMRDARTAAGARVLDLPAAHLRVRDGVPSLEARGNGAGDLLVAEAMVAFNRVAAGRIKAAGAAALWRAQDPPRGDLPPRDDPLFALKARRLFAPTRISADPAPHSGVGAPFYLQATSPIRRYADLLHQRQLAALVSGAPPPHGREELRALALELFRAEREARAAESEREAYWLAVLLERRGAAPLRGICSRSPERGRGHAWIPDLLDDLPFRWPRDGGPGPAEGAELELRPGRLAKHRARVELEVVA